MDTEAISNNATLQKSTWEYLYTDLADPRTSAWFLMSNPTAVLVIVASYLYFVLKWGPNYMKDKKPYDLRRTLMIYNLLQVVANFYIFNEAVRMWSNFNWNCQPIDWSNNPTAIRHAWACYLYFLNKISDLLDTVFFVLRKKDKQITLLHVFHHTIMPLVSWALVKYFPGGHVTFIGLLNTFVHVLLYSYYYLASLGPSVQKYLWWKKYLTRIQLIQFCLIFIHNIQLFYFDCGFPKWTVLLTLPNAVVFFFLFNDFYKKSYNSPKTKERLNKSDKNN